MHSVYNSAILAYCLLLAVYFLESFGLQIVNNFLRLA